MLGLLRFPPLLLLVVASALRAQDRIEAPPVGRPLAYSQVIGRGFTLHVEAEPRVVMVEDPILLKVQIRTSAPPQDPPVQNRLQLFPPGLQQAFYIENVSSPLHLKNDLWEFHWRLRPKNQRVERIPSLQLAYYHSGFRKYQTIYAGSIPIQVRPRDSVKATDVQEGRVVSAPEWMYQLAQGPGLLRDERAHFSWWLLAVLFLGPPVLCGAGWLAWRTCVPEAAALARRRRSRAARHARGALRRVRHDPQGEVVTAILNRYLRDRLGLASAELTPAEVVEPLRRAGVNSARVAALQTVLHQCALARFASARVSIHLPAAVSRTIDEVETELCSQLSL